MEIFKVFADGLYRACRRCRRVTIFASDEARERSRVPNCGACGSTEGHVGRPRPEARLFVARSAPAMANAGALGEWSAADARRLLGLEGRVYIEGDPGAALHAARSESPASHRGWRGARPARRDDRESREYSKEAQRSRPGCIARRMQLDFRPGLTRAIDPALRSLASADVHLAPYDLADLDSTVLASCALGVATVTTRFGAAAEILPGVARLVPPGVTLDASEGHRLAVMHIGGAVRELLELADDPAVRREEGIHARRAMGHMRPSAVAARWRALLEPLATA
jgi:hypothetical protein